MRPSPVIAQPGQGFASRQRQVRGAKRVGNTGVAWPGAVPLALGLYFLLGLRLHEVVPGIHVLRLPFVMLIVALPLIYTKTKGKAFGYLWANKTFRYAALFSCWCVASVPGSVWVGRSAAAAQGLIPTLVLVAAFLLCPLDSSTLRRVQEGMVAGAAVLGSLVVVLGRATGGRAKVSTSLDPNDIAAILAFSIPLAISLLYSPKFRHRVVGLGSLGALFAGLAVTSSRGAIVALGAATVVLVAAQSAKRQAALIVVLVVCGFGLWTYAPPTFRERMTSLGTLDNDYNTYEYSGRSNLWKRGMGYVATNPVLGVGMSAFGIAEGKKLESMGERGQWLTAHNTYLQVAAEVGIPGFILFLCFFVSPVRGLMRIAFAKHAFGVRSRQPELLAAWTSCAVSSFFLSHGYLPALYGLISFLALAVMTSARARQAESTAPAPDPMEIELHERVATIMRGQERLGS